MRNTKQVNKLTETFFSEQAGQIFKTVSMLVCTRGTSENVDHRYAFRNLHLFKQEWQIWKCYCRYIAHQQFLRFMFGELYLLIFFREVKEGSLIDMLSSSKRPKALQIRDIVPKL